MQRLRTCRTVCRVLHSTLHNQGHAGAMLCQAISGYRDCDVLAGPCSMACNNSSTCALPRHTACECTSYFHAMVQSAYTAAAQRNAVHRPGLVAPPIWMAPQVECWTRGMVACTHVAACCCMCCTHSVIPTTAHFCSGLVAPAAGIVFTALGSPLGWVRICQRILFTAATACSFKLHGVWAVTGDLHAALHAAAEGR
jgi:hypothetical protein